MSVHELIQAEAFRLGFLLAGVAPAAPPAHYAAYERWVGAGLHAEMGYLANDAAREKRADPRRVMPGAKSVLVAAMRYAEPSSIPAPHEGAGVGRVAAYAWSDDYHLVIPPLLAELAAAVEKELGQPLAARGYTDTGPILERDLGMAAGLGWSGKNTCLISPRHGSFFLIGETLIDQEIEPSKNFMTDHCGSCRRCIEACPTQCIREDRTIDSARCISYQTIENKGAIPADLRPKIGSWVFGCDICQAVCPWNIRFSAPGASPALPPDPNIAHPVLREEIHLTPQAFNRKFKRSPILRAKRRGYLRSTAVAMGNQKDPAAAADLKQVLESETEPLVRAHAAWALGQIGTRSAREALDKQKTVEPDESVKREIFAALDGCNEY